MSDFSQLNYATSFSVDYCPSIQAMSTEICERYAPRPRTARKLPSEAVVSSLIFHQLQPGGTLAAHGAQLHGITVWGAINTWGDRDVQVLVRVRDNINAEVLQPLPDGSALIEVVVREEGRKVGKLQLREIQARGVGVNGKRFKLRLWTTLLDATRYPAQTLARHYAEHWEHELYYRELKLDVRNAPILASHTVETALQEVSAVVLASAALARLRVSTADQLKLPASRMSFFKVMLATQQLWSTLEFIGAVLTQAQRTQVWEKYMDTVRHTAVLPERRARSCPRVLRQPVKSWPRKTNQRSRTGQVEIKVVRV